jgi:hypothetical protein
MPERLKIESVFFLYTGDCESAESEIRNRKLPPNDMARISDHDRH